MSVRGRDTRNQAWPEQRPCYREQVLCLGPGVSGLNQTVTGLGNLTTGPGAWALCTSVWETFLSRFPLAQGLQGPRWSQRQAFQVSDSLDSHPDSLHPSLWEEQVPGLLPPQPCFWEPRSPGLSPRGSPLPPKVAGAYGPHGPPAPAPAQTQPTLLGAAAAASAWRTARGGTLPRSAPATCPPAQVRLLVLTSDPALGWILSLPSNSSFQPQPVSSLKPHI